MKLTYVILLETFNYKYDHANTFYSSQSFHQDVVNELLPNNLTKAYLNSSLSTCTCSSVPSD